MDNGLTWPLMSRLNLQCLGGTTRLCGKIFYFLGTSNVTLAQQSATCSPSPWSHPTWLGNSGELVDNLYTCAIWLISQYWGSCWNCYIACSNRELDLAETKHSCYDKKTIQVIFVLIQFHYHRNCPLSPLSQETFSSSHLRNWPQLPHDSFPMLKQLCSYIIKT